MIHKWKKNIRADIPLGNSLDDKFMPILFQQSYLPQLNTILATLQYSSSTPQNHRITLIIIK